MKLVFLEEKIFDLLLIAPRSLSYFSLEKNKTSFKILKSETLNLSLFEEGLFKFENLEKGILFFINKYKLKELGIVLNFPKIIFQRVSLPRGGHPQETIINYLRATFPLPLEKYTFFYKEDKYKLSPVLSNFNIFFIEKSLIDYILTIIEKFGIIPLFISPSLETVYQYLLSKSLIDFNEEYLVFFMDQDLIIALLIKNLRIEKLISEEIDLQKADLDSVILRIYHFLKTNLSSEAKIIFLHQNKKELPEISHQQIFLKVSPLEVLLEGSFFIFKKVFNDQEFIDFLPLKSYSAYFVNRLPSVMIFLSIYLAFLFFIFSLTYLGFELVFKKEIDYLKKLPSSQEVQEVNQEQLERFFNLEKVLNLSTQETFAKIKNILLREDFQNLNYSLNQPLNFELKVEKENLEKVKLDLAQKFPQAKLIQEEQISDKEVKLIYSF